MKKNKNNVVTNYMKDPQEILAENSINMRKAQLEGATDPMANILNTGAGFGTMIAKAFAMGGQNMTQDVKVDDGEVIETPDGKMGKVKGNPDEVDGVDASLPIGTKIFSDILQKEGESMAKRKEDRESRLAKIMKKLDKNPSDRVLKNSRKRVEEQNAAEEAEDMQLQEMMTQMMGMMKSQEEKGYFLGTDEEGIDGVEAASPDEIVAGLTKTDAYNNGFSPAASNDGDDEGGGLPFSLGDGLGIAGNLYSMFKLRQNTLNSRATDTPHQNQYEGFGEDALESIDQSKGYAQESGDQLLQEIRQNAQASKRSGRVGARGINTQRAMDLAVDQGVNDATGKAQAQLAQQMMKLMGMEAQMENQQDKMEMTGAAQADANNRADKDNYYSNRAQDIASMGEGLQQTGKDLNQVAQNKLIMNMLNQMSNYFQMDKKGNITNRKTE